ncbi:uncharacterized protein LOC128876273 isoform X1 [Hylaeus volcanicus]|uniref:uncharacterized protein LOC128876273 isoform X1 n=1 Tax=Hylaeus volcanicus TaxID=313075 RepID=UPI0023B8567A|nr:uncharacterized protein LOC128876273 isoform X1 [Hylaeus volcanicus]
MKANFLFYNWTLLIASVLCEKRGLLDPEVVSWISNEDFRVVIQSSFRFSKCCSVLFNDSIEASRVLFNQFRSVYRGVYLLERSVSDCNGYLLLGSSDEEIRQFLNKIPTLLWKTEIVIIVNDNLSSTSGIFDDSLYEIANVNIVSVTGIWSLSENYLKPRIFSKLISYRELEHGHDNFNFRGRELRVCSIFQPPMTYFNRTVNRVIDGVQAEVYVIDDDLHRDGIETQLFLDMAEKLNFTWTIRKPDGDTTYGRRFNATAWKDGMISMLRESKADMAFASIWMTHDQNQFVHLSDPWHQVYISFLVPRPRRTTTFWALTRPFPGKIWSLLASLLLLQILYMCARAWVDPKYPKRYQNFFVSLFVLIGAFLSSSVPRTAPNNKLHVLLWQVAGWLIITAYSSSLAARLATTEYEDRIDTIDQFLAANLSWGHMNQPPPFKDYFDLTNPHAAQLPNRYRTVKNPKEAKKLISDGNYAIIGKIVDNFFFPDDQISNDDLKNYRLMRESVGRFYTSFALQPWLQRPVNRMMLLLKETGITVWHLRNVIRRRDCSNLREVLIEHDGYDGSIQVLGLTPLAAGFSLLIAGSSMAVFVFYLELKRASGSNTIGHLLECIASKRAAQSYKTLPLNGVHCAKEIHFYAHTMRYDSNAVNRGLTNLDQ